MPRASSFQDDQVSLEMLEGSRYPCAGGGGTLCVCVCVCIVRQAGRWVVCAGATLLDDDEEGEGDDDNRNTPIRWARGVKTAAALHAVASRGRWETAEHGLIEGSSSPSATRLVVLVTLRLRR